MNETELIQFIEKDAQEVKDSLFEMASHNIKPSPLKSREEIEDELRKNIDIAYSAYITDWVSGINYYIDRVEESEAEKLAAIIGKITTHAVQYITQADLSDESKITRNEMNFLAEVSRREMAKKDYPAAACMFRILIKLNPLYTYGWLGWAVCEQELNHPDVAEQVYEQALSLLPDDVDLCQFAVDFYVKQGKKDRAKEVLNEALSIMKKEGIENPSLKKRIQSL